MDARTEAARAELESVGAERYTARDYRPGTVLHIVLFRVVDPAAAADVLASYEHLVRSPRADGRPYIRSITGGPQLSAEGVGRGFGHGFVVHFDSQGDRNYFVGSPIVDDPAFVDPEHVRFKNAVGPLLEPDGVLVFDL